VIGHDLIDLSGIQAISSDRLQRLQRKVLTREEENLLDQHFGPSLGYWVAWAAKEAVYKLEFKIEPQRYFRPRAIQCQDLTQDSSAYFCQLRVQGRVGTYPVYVRKIESRLEAIALATKESIPQLRTYLGWKNATGPWHSEDTQAHLFQLIAQDFQQEEIIYRRKPFPQLFHQKKELPLSISHDGSWLSIALLDI
jgi:phosphopantetheinyl transferase (holo-ACP synthase)